MELQRSSRIYLYAISQNEIFESEKSEFVKKHNNYQYGDWDYIMSFSFVHKISQIYF